MEVGSECGVGWEGVRVALAAVDLLRLEWEGGRAVSGRWEGSRLWGVCGCDEVCTASGQRGEGLPLGESVLTLLLLLLCVALHQML